MTTFAELDEDAAGLAWALDGEIVYTCAHCLRDIDIVSEYGEPGEFVHVDTGRHECRGKGKTPRSRR